MTVPQKSDARRLGRALAKSLERLGLKNSTARLVGHLLRSNRINDALLVLHVAARGARTRTIGGSR